MSEKELTPIRPQILEYHKLEIEEIFTGIREFTNLRAQILFFLGTANLTALGFAFGTQKSGLLLVAAGISLIAVTADSYVRRHQNAFFYRGLQLEKKYCPQQEHALLSTYVAVAAGEKTLANLRTVANLKDQKACIQALRHARSSVFGFWLPITIALVESVTGILLWLRLGWSLF